MKKIIKKLGGEELFDEKKFCQNLTNIGIDYSTSNKICRNIYDKLPSIAKSSEVFKLTLNELKKINNYYALRYNLKKAIFDLGPTGYPFEQYFAKILAEYGYETIINEFVEGQCLSYEIDIIAVKDNQRYLIECKFHQSFEIPSDLKNVLYIYGRWIDIKEKYSELIPWLVTNTRLSEEAIVFAQCRDIKLTAWKYPPDESLEKLIEEKNLYPVTIILNTNKFIIKKLIENHYVITNDLLRDDIENIFRKTGIEKNKIKKILDEIKILGI
ncbi:MAG: restriction endonuclease [Patescibacteria group bacterium]|nr:restriction endonuclease [Patescibacteria group bacterium]